MSEHPARVRDRRMQEIPTAAKDMPSQGGYNTEHSYGSQSAKERQPGRIKTADKATEMLQSAVVDLKHTTGWSKTRVLETIAVGADMSIPSIRRYLQEGIPPDRRDNVLYNGVEHAYRQSWDTPDVWLGKPITRLLEITGWTRDYLAARLGKTVADVRKWENKVRKPWRQTQRRLDEIWMAASQ